MILLAVWLAALLAAPAVGRPLPWFAGWSADDRVINRTQVLATPAEGRVIVLFATWCAPCATGLDALSKARAAGDLKGIEPVLVACGEPPETVQPWLAARGWAGSRVIYDRFGAIARDLGVETAGATGRTLALPRVVVTDGGGVVRAVFDGARAHDVEAITAALQPTPGPKTPIRPPAAR